MTLSGITKEGISYWDPQNPFTEGHIALDMAAISKGVATLPLDDAINYLYALGFADAAKEINQAAKEADFKEKQGKLF